MTSWTLSEFFAHLRDLDVRLSLDGDRLACSAPKGALSAELRAELQRRKPEILKFLGSVTTAGSRSAPPLVPADSSDVPALSYAQQRLWFLDRMEPGNPIYNMTAALRMIGDLDRAAIERSLRAILDRHAALRTTFRDTDDEPIAVVGTADGWRMDVDDLSGITDDAREAEMLRRAVSEVRKPFDLAAGPLFRAKLFALGPTEHVLVLSMHHIVSDGWSIGVIADELSKFYSAFRSGDATAPVLPPLPVQYGDYAIWHRRWMETGVLDEQLPFWRRTLVPPLPNVDLPLDRPRPALQTHRGRQIVFSISAQLTEDLRQLGRQQNATLFMTLLAAFNILLKRYTGQDDVIVGTALAGRDRPELAGLVGFFVNNIVLRSDLSGNPTVAESIRRTSRTVLDAFANQDVPFDRLVEAIRPERSLNRSPLFQTLFVLQNWPFTGLQLSGLDVSHLELDLESARFDLNIDAMERADGVRFYFNFNTDLFDVATIERMRAHYERLLEAMVATPTAAIGDLPMLSTDESRRLAEWNATDSAFPEAQRVDELIAAQAARTPDAEAVRYDDVGLSYTELMRRSNQLANRLRALGVGPDKLVGVSLDRTHEMVVAVLAVWKAGGAYVPLDPSYPRDRIAFMMEDAGLAALVTEESLLAEIPAATCPVLLIDRDAEAIAAESDAVPQRLSGPRNLAYVIYTSGSTGKPKGVLIEHRSVVNFLTSMQRVPGLADSDSLLSVTTLSFDIAGLELYLPLITGARVVLVSRAVAADGIALARAIVDSRATVMQATPATWRMLLDTGWTNPSRVRILCGGEALPRGLANGLLASGAEVWNLYGPTETTIWSTVQRVGPAGDPVPIGRPIANTQLYVLDAHRQPVPVNVPGELYIGGAGLARGYHNRPELTAERFIAHPFAADAQARLYRTGDQVRYTPDGTLEYLGRLDTQVKVRGFRIELGEIESVLATHAAVQHAVVIAREDVPGDVRLVAYLVGADGARVSSGDLRRWLGGLLPHYMVPAAFVFVDSLPLTPNGKVDRRALPAPSESGQQASPSFVSPRAGIESAVAEIWRSVLRVERVGVDDNFFDLGGHSLLVVQMQSRLRDRFACELSLLELFRRPTVGAIAEYVSANATPATVADTPDRIAATT